MPRPLKIGIEVPLAENRAVSGAPRWADVSAMARRAEDVGFDSIWVEDHLLFRSSSGTQSGVWECWSMLAAIAAVTSRVEIGPLVTATNFRNPALLAKMADTVDEISGGRLILGLGAGSRQPDFDAFGYPFAHRVSRFEEALTIVHSLLKTGHVDFEGRFYSARECELRPRGPRSDGPPILIGTIGERMLELTARYADLWNAYFSHTNNRAEGVMPLRERVDAACRDAGRDPATLGRTAAVLINLTRDDRADVPSRNALTPLSGEPEAIADELRAYANQGVDHVIVWLEPNTAESIDAFAPVLDIFATDEA